jgi:3-(3-hydroxy-phenyl)propionate hydroxylase
VSERVLVAGGGPVGMVTALALARRGFPVSVFEAEDRIDDAPRASTTHPATLELLDELGLAGEAIRDGVVARTFQFRDRTNDAIIAEFDHQILRSDTRFPLVVQYEQHKLARLALKHLLEYPGAEVHFSARVLGAEPAARHVDLIAETAQGSKRFRGGLLVGADGGRSAVRKSMGIAFDGYTWPERFIVLTTRFDFEAERGYCFRTYFSDPEEWANLFKVAGEDGKGLWRVVFPTRLEESDESALADTGVQERLMRFFPRRTPYEVVHRNLYKVHQRVAAAFRKGRVLLAGDAAHVNNPIGGLGLNCGIHDAVELARCLERYCGAEGGEGTLDIYDRRRRTVNIEFVQSQTVANKKRLEEKDPAVRAKSFDELKATAADPVRHRAFLLRTSLIDSVRKAALIR